MDSPGDFDLQVLAVSFLVEMRDVKRASPHTLDAYRRDLDQTFLRLTHHPAVVDPAMWTRQALEDILAAMVAQGSAATSVARLTSTWRSFGFYCVRQGALSDNPATLLSAPEFKRELPKHVSREALYTAIGKLNGSRESDLRDRAVLEVLCSCGLRIAEFARLSLGDLNTSEGTLTARTRRGETRQLAISERAIVAIQRYIRLTGRESNPPFAPLFLGGQGGVITEQSIRQALHRRLGDMAEDFSVTARDVREAFALWLLEEGADLSEVKRAIGHRWLASTQIFEHAMKKRSDT